MASRLPLDGERLQASHIWQICKTHPFVTRGAINLWIAANSARPCGKLPDNETALAKAADVCLPDFREHRDLYLHGFIQDGKGSLFHPVIVEIASGPAKRSRRKVEDYSPEFEKLWNTFDAAKNAPGSSKLDAWKAYQEMGDDRPIHNDLIQLIRSYISTVSKRQSYCAHLSTVLRQRRWESLVGPSSIVAPADEARAKAAWGGLAKPLVEEIGVAAFLAYFDGSSVRKGPPFLIRVKTISVKNTVEKHYYSRLRKCFGDFQIEVQAAAKAA